MAGRGRHPRVGLARRLLHSPAHPGPRGPAALQRRARQAADHRHHTRHLLPGPDDHDRYLLEAGTRLALRLDTVIRDLVRGSLRDGHEHAADFPGFRLGVFVRADDGHETYVAIRITGSIPTNLTAMILARVPGCAADGWFPEYALPERHLLPAEQAWSNLMDPKTAAQLLDNQD